MVANAQVNKINLNSIDLTSLKNDAMSKYQNLTQHAGLNKKLVKGSPLQAPQQADAVKQLIDSTYSYDWDANTNNWSSVTKYLGKVIYGFDAQGNKISSTCKDYFPNGGIDVTRIDYTYDSNKNLTKELNKETDGNLHTLFVATERNWIYDQKNNLSFFSSERVDKSSTAVNIPFEDFRKYENKQDQYSFDINSNQTCHIHRDWNTKWVNTTKDSTLYNAKNHIIFSLTQQWDGVTSSWVNIKKSGTIYGTNGTDSTSIELVQYWKNDAWADSTKTSSNVHYVNNVADETAIEEKWLNGTWVNSSKSIMVVDITNIDTLKILSLASQIWNGTDWVNYFQYSNITYRDGFDGMFTYAVQLWNANAWLTLSERTFDANTNTATETGILEGTKSSTLYDANFNPIRAEYQRFMSPNWDTDSIKTAGYDSDNLLKYKTIKRFANNLVVKSDSTYNYYHKIINGVQNIKLTDNGVSVFPNPSNGKFIISSPESSVNAVEIFNLLGDKVYSNANQPAKSEIDLSTAAKGIYIIKINNGTKSNSTKIVIQ